jgi:diadenosine tetraphosphate (Ap4A) HIT family hydrolase
LSKWNDANLWQSLLDGSACPVCVRGFPLDVIASLESCWLTMSEEAVTRGYVCQVSRVHAVELYDLTETQANNFMQDARRISRALSSATGAVKLNYEIHGNTLPHLHMHFFPRYIGDQFEGKPIDPGKASRTVYESGEFAVVRDRLLKELS